jgi:hypothetical protein
VDLHLARSVLTYKYGVYKGLDRVTDEHTNKQKIEALFDLQLGEGIKNIPDDDDDDDDDDVYLNKLQTKGVKKSILYMQNVDQPIRHK